MKEVSEHWLNPREEIHQLIQNGDLETLLEKAGELHGHYCPGVALGVKAAYIAMKKLALDENTGMEEIMAVTECNNCFVDGIQFVSGCSFGNNALIYKDLGKTAVTFYRRGGEKALRLCAKKFEIPGEPEDEKKEGDQLFQKAVTKREPLTDDEQKRMKELWIRRSWRTVAAPDEALFEISELPAPTVSFAPIYDSQNCSVCGESVMETRMTMQNGKPVCLTCAKAEYSMIAGKGILSCGAVQ